MGSQIIVRDNRWLMVADRQRIERRLYDDDEEADDDITRYDDVANDEPGKLSDLSETATDRGGRHPAGVRPGRGHAPDARARR